jgi:hypothetical protein
VLAPEEKADANLTLERAEGCIERAAHVICESSVGYVRRSEVPGEEGRPKSRDDARDRFARRKGPPPRHQVLVGEADRIDDRRE